MLKNSLIFLIRVPLLSKKRLQHWTADRLTAEKSQDAQKRNRIVKQTEDTYKASERYFDPTSPILKAIESSRLSRFRIVVAFAPYPFNELERSDVVKVLYENLYEVFLSSGLRRSSTEYWSDINVDQLGAAQKTGSEARQKDHWLKIKYTEPGRSFQVSLSDTQLEISCIDPIFANLVSLSATVFQRILLALTESPVSNILRVRERVHSLDYLFNLEFRIEEDIVQRHKQKNHQILQQSLNLVGKPTQDRSESNAFPSLGLEEFIRLDLNQHGLKSFRNKKYNVKFHTEAPFNERNSILFVTAGLAMEEDFDFDLDVAINIEVAFVDFFRDVVLRRVLDNLLCKVKYQIG
ncbi:MAG: hypothetical protein IOD05_02505 [Rhodobacter sp.]|nr:hypothetical protein [Microcystis sp. M045S2]MCA3488438.1 hypothetical protein [Rhodobacter sp.]MCA3493737.1 hypothetical protein [Rhodobacter sp.]MCA3500068.1 hypothetical protein [Rhodobacter sp.]MCA3502135.1 hypothetical protein [Rhodobacter sp.]